MLKIFKIVIIFYIHLIHLTLQIVLLQRSQDFHVLQSEIVLLTFLTFVMDYQYLFVITVIVFVDKKEQPTTQTFKGCILRLEE